MEYNTERNKVEIMDYGRNVYKLIEYAKTIEDREKRTRVAEAIVWVMAQVNPKVQVYSDFRRKLWNHLMVLANGELDVDSPFPISRNTSLKFSPRQMSYKSEGLRYRHYGRYMQRMIERVSEYPEGEERAALEKQLAQMMKRSYMGWNHDTAADDVIAGQMESMSGGRIHLQHDAPIELPSLTGVQPDDFYERKTKSGKKKKKK